jgi:hypothetical protein
VVQKGKAGFSGGLKLSDKYSTRRQTLNLGELILKQIYPDATIKTLAGPNEPDFMVEHIGKRYEYDMKIRTQNYNDILLEFGSLADTGQFSIGWLFKHPEWWTLYVFERSGLWHIWQNKDLISRMTQGPVRVNALIPSRKGNTDYTTFSIAFPSDVLDHMPTWISGNWKNPEW